MAGHKTAGGYLPKGRRLFGTYIFIRQRHRPNPRQGYHRRKIILFYQATCLFGRICLIDHFLFEIDLALLQKDSYQIQVLIISVKIFKVEEHVVIVFMIARR